MKNKTLMYVLLAVAAFFVFKMFGAKSGAPGTGSAAGTDFSYS